MFKSGFIRLRNVYNSISKLYTLIIVQHPLATIICYILLMTSFSLGLFQLRFDSDSESLTELHHSRSRRHKQYLDEIFPLRQDEGFLQYRLTNMGYYVEVIIKTKNGTMFSKENAQLFKEYDTFFDHLMNLEMIDYAAADDNEVYKYKYNQLCASRLGKCAVEGGLVRTESFKRNFFSRKVSYEAHDAKMMYMDTEAADGISVGFTFGKSPRQKCHRKRVSDTSKETKLVCTVTGFNIIRNRLDLKFKDAEDRRKAIGFMHEFVKFMQSLKLVTNLYPSLDFSFHTSHTLQSEIEYYSQFDLKYMALMFLGFWTVFFMLMWLDVSLIRKLFSRPNAADHTPKASCLFEWFDKINWFFINSSGLLIIATVIQYFATLIATLGLMSLFGVAANQILYTIIIVLMFTVCHQSILLFKTIKNMNKKLPTVDSQSQMPTRKQSMVPKSEATKKTSNESTRLAEAKQNISTDIIKVIDDDLDEIGGAGRGSPKSLRKSKTLDESDFSSEDKEKLIRAIQQIMVPGFCTLMISMFSYFLIGLTNGYDAVRIYCFFMAICLLINFFGLVAFYCPCLVLHLKRVKTNRNCLLFCYKHAPFSPNNKTNLTTTSGLNNSTTVINLDSSVDDEQHTVAGTTAAAQIAAKKRSSKSRSVKSLWERVCRFVASINTNNVDFLKYKKLKVLLLLVFVGYFAFNFTITITRLKINLPMLDLLPKQSYLHEHMKNHMAHFKLGPVIILNFVKPMKYWEAATRDKILGLVDDMKRLKGMSQLEINWLRDVYDGMTNEYNIEFKDQCNPEKVQSYNYTNCFASVMGEYLNEEQNREDVVFKLNLGPEMNKKPEVHDYKLMVHMLDEVKLPSQLLIKSSRIYLSLADFRGVRFEADLLNSLKDLAAERYNLTEDTLIIYTSIGAYLEQLDEIYPTVISIFLIFFECIFFGCLVLIFDLRTMFLHIINMLSVFLAILANMFLFDLSLNVATLLQLIMLPALLNEFFVYPTYLYLYMSERKRPHRQLTHNYKLSALKSLLMLKIKSYSCTMTINNKENNDTRSTFDGGVWWDMPSNRRRIARANFAYAKSSKHSVHLLLASLVFSISFLYYCQTYNFNALFAILSSSFFNLILHLYIFYPILLNVFGPNWS